MSSWCARRHQVANPRADSRQKCGLVNTAGQVPLRQSRQLLRELGGDLLDRDVVLHVAVVLGEPFVDLDGQPQSIGNRLRGLHRAPLRAADQPSDGEAGQRVGQPLGLFDTFLGQVGVRALPGFAAKGKRMSDQKQLHRDTINPVRAFACPVCNNFTQFEAARCRNCHAALGFHPPSKSMLPVADGVAQIDGQRWVRCTQSETSGCNWLAAEEQSPYERGRCLADSLIRREPDASDTIAREKLVPTAVALRRLVYQLDDIGLPIDPFWRHDGGLAFDLLSSYSTGEKVTIGHAGGVITIDLVESLDAYRESLRVRLGEPYRTMLGHFRHEVGHYYQHVLVESGSGAHRYLDDCRRLFGDERASYGDAISRHYKFGAPDGWHEAFISEYATMHPWEDFAECFAHYLHITDTIDTSREAGMVLRADLVRFSAPRDIAPLESYDDVPIERLLFDWRWISLFFNRVNTAMGKIPLYPFEIPEPVVTKLGFIHRVIRETARDR